MKGSLLEGNIRRQLITLAAPLMIGNILQQLYNTVDSLIIGRFLGTEAFSAVGIAGTIMNLFIFVLTGFCTGISVILAQLYGSGDRSAFRKEVFVAISLGTGITLALSGLFLALMRPVLVLINSPAELIGYIESYLLVIIGGMLATYFYNLFSGILRAIGDTRAATLFLFIAVTVNAMLDLLFVGKLGTGIAGAAWATVIAQLLSAICCLLYLLRRDRDLLCTRYEFQFEKSLVRQTMKFGFSSALHQSTLYIGKIFVQGAVNTLGTAGIAGYTATMRVEGFANSIGNSVGHGLSVFASQNKGAGQDERAREGVKQGMILSIIMGLCMSAAMYVTAEAGMRIFLDASETEAIAQGAGYMRLIALFYLLCFTGNSFAGFFRGVGQIRVMLMSTLMHILCRVIFSHLLVGSMGLPAVALATGIGWTLMAVFQIYNYRRVR